MAALSETSRCDHLFLFIIGSTVLTLCSATHFRGGTISYTPLGDRTFQFYFKLSWTYINGLGCTPNTTGQFIEFNVTALGTFWKCVNDTCGIGKSVHLSSVGYTCTGANEDEDWEQGERRFNYTFPSNMDGPFVVEYSSKAWISLGGGKGSGPWSIRTTVDMRTRGDIGMPNSSPVALSQAMYKRQYGCFHELQIPTYDPDGDTVRCRWAKGFNECGSVCDALPSATLNETTCIITFDATKSSNYKAGEFYGVAVMIEDYPRTTITYGNETKTPSDVLSSTPLQFLIQTPEYDTPCEEKPEFIPPTPAEGSIVYVQAGTTLTVKLVAHNGNDNTTKINSISISGPAVIEQSNLNEYQSAPNAYVKTLTWNAKSNDLGTHLVCAYASNSKGKTSDSRCFTVAVFVVENPYVIASTAAIPPLLPSCLSSQGIPVYAHKDSCETTDYCDCQCFISPNDPPEEDNTLRYLVAAILCLQIGLVLSLLTTWLYYYCRRSPLPPPKVRRKRRPKAKKSITKTAPPCDTHHKKTTKKMAVHDRLARRMTCDRPWCEVHRHRHRRASIMSLRKIMKMIRKK